MGTLQKLKAKTVINSEETRKENIKLVNEKSATKDKRQKRIRTVADIMRNSNFANCKPIYFPKKHKK
jgi:hypothetical protein